MNHNTQFYTHDVPTAPPTSLRRFPNLCTCRTHSRRRLSLLAELRRYRRYCRHLPGNLACCQRKPPLHCVAIRPPTAADPHLRDIQLRPRLPSNSLAHIQQSSFLFRPVFRSPLTTVANRRTHPHCPSRSRVPMLRCL